MRGPVLRFKSERMSFRPPSSAKFVLLSVLVLALATGTALAYEVVSGGSQTFLFHWAIGAAAGALATIVVMAFAVVYFQRSRKETQQAADQMERLLDTFPTSTVILDRKHRILRLNRQAERLFGYQREELLRQPFVLLIPERVEELLTDGDKDSSGVPVSALDPSRYREGRRKDGRTVPLEVRCRLLAWANDTVILAVMRDATELQRTERSLREVEAKYRAIFENAAEGIYQLTQEGRFITANPAFARMLGYESPEELMAKVTDVKKQVFVEPSQRSMIRILSEQSGRARGFEYQAYRKDGRKIWVMGNQRVVRDASNRVIYYEGNIEEITERKRAEEALRESQRALLTLMSNLPGMAYRCRNDRERTMEFVSDGAFELTGRASADFLQNRTVAFGQLIHSEDRERVWKEIQDALREDRPYQLEYRLQVSGRDKTVWEQGRGVRSFSDENRLALEGLIIDVDERARARDNLRKSEEQFRLVAENVHGVFWMTNVQQTEIIFVNSAYERIWGRTRASLYKNPRSWLDAVDPQDRERVRAATAKIATGDYDIEYRILRDKNDVRWIWDRAFPIKDDKDQIYRVAGIAEDITERKKLEEQFRQAQKMEAIGRLAGGIAHDFNNLLCIMNGYSDMLKTALQPGTEAHEYSLRIGTAGERAANLTRQLLAFSRKTMLIPKVLDLNVLLSSMGEMIKRLIGEDIAFSLKLDENLGQVEADPGQLEQVVMNLVVNSRDAMPRGGSLTIETRNTTLDEEFARKHEGVESGAYVMMEVRDTGCGMDEAHMSRIFEPFFTTKEVGKGTGLGLSMVYGIVKQSGGEVDVSSEIGRGTSFLIYLPRVAVASKGDATADQPVADHGQETILLVEDEAMVREMAHNLLIRSGYSVLQASSGQEALELVERTPGTIHLLITDVVMPGMNGAELEKRFAAKRPGARAMFMTGYTDSALTRYGIFDARRPVLLKPFAPDDFLRTVREVLDGK
jgi:PAS domain S-box-containing protein